jgi:hypothetical protein
MPIDPNIALAGRPGQFENPLDSLARVLSVKNEMARSALIPGQVQLQQQQLQQGQQQLDSTRVMNDAYRQPGIITTGPGGTPAIDTNALSDYLGKNGQGHLIPGMVKAGMDLTEAGGKITEQRSKLAGEESDYAGLVGARAVTKNADGTQTTDAGTLALGLKHAAALYGPQSPSAQALAALEADPTKADAIAGQLIKGSPKQAQLAAEATTAAARKQTAETGAAKLPGDLDIQKQTLAKVTAEATLATAKAKLAQNPQAYSSVVDSLSLPPDLANRAKSQVSFYIKNGQIDEANKALDKAVEDANAPGKAAAVETATAPLKTAQAVATARATAPIETQRAIATAKALREGDNPALAGVPPALATQVQTAATKLDQDYVSAKTAAEDIANLLKMARGGNVAAGANIPLAGVGAINAVNGIKRINQAEIQQYGTAGSLIQKIQGKLQGWTEGKPIPDSVLNDMATVHEMLAGGAYQKYTSNLAALNQRSGAKYGPAFEAPKPLGGSGGAKTINTQADYNALPKGATYIDAADGKQYQKK